MRQFHVKNFAEKFLSRAVIKNSMFRKLKVESRPEGLEFFVARSRTDLEDALLAGERRKESRQVDSRLPDLRITKFHTLPSTKVFVAKRDDQIVATLTVIREGIFGLPLDSFCNLNHLKHEGRSLAEITSFCLLDDNLDDRESQMALFGLFKFVCEYSRDHFGVDALVIGAEAKERSFFKEILLFSSVESDFDKPRHENITPLYLDLHEMKTFFAIEYGRMPAAKNLFNFFYGGARMSERRKSTRGLDGVINGLMEADDFEYFFRIRSNVFESLSELELVKLRAIYSEHPYDRLFPSLSDSNLSYLSRKNRRYDVNLKGHAVTYSGKTFDVKVQDISSDGMRAYLTESLSKDEVLRFKIRLGEYDVMELVAQPVWNEDHGFYGFQVVNSCMKWKHFVTGLKRKKFSLDDFVA